MALKGLRLAVRCAILNQMRACVGFALLLLFGGCYDDSAFLALTPGGSEGTSSASSGGNPSGATSSSPATSTTAAEASSGGESEVGSGGSDGDSTGEPSMPVDPPPTVTFSASPTSIEQASPITIEVEHSSDVEMLYLLDGEDVVASWLPSEPPPEYLILQKEGLDARPLRVRAVDDSQQEALSGVVWIETKLPPSGTELWRRSITLGEPTQGSALTSSAGAYGSIELLVGANVEWQGRSLRLNAEGNPALAVQPIEVGQSWIGGITHGPDGDALVVGTQLVGNDTRPWIARVSALGDILDFDQGKVGDAATGVAVDLVTGRVYVSGYRFTPNTDGHFDAMLWAHAPDGSPLWETQWERPLPPKAQVGKAADFAWGVAVVKNPSPDQPDDVVLVGESRLDIELKKTAYRAFVRRYSSTGVLLAEWMSTTPPSSKQGHAVCSQTRTAT